MLHDINQAIASFLRALRAECPAAGPVPARDVAAAPAVVTPPASLPVFGLVGDGGDAALWAARKNHQEAPEALRKALQKALQAPESVRVREWLTAAQLAATLAKEKREWRDRLTAARTAAERDVTRACEALAALWPAEFGALSGEALMWALDALVERTELGRRIEDRRRELAALQAEATRQTRLAAGRREHNTARAKRAARGEQARQRIEARRQGKRPDRFTRQALAEARR